jgi:hypothetical protein
MTTTDTTPNRTLGGHGTYFVDIDRKEAARLIRTLTDALAESTDAMVPLIITMDDRSDWTSKSSDRVGMVNIGTRGTGTLFGATGWVVDHDADWGVTA